MVRCLVGVGLGDAEDGDDPVGSGDLDLGDEGFDQGLAHVIGAGVDHLVDVVGDLQGGGLWRGGFGVECLGQLVAAGAELCAGGAEFGEAWADEFLIEGAVFAGLFRPHLSGEFWPHLVSRRPGRETSPEQDFPPLLAALEETTGGPAETSKDTTEELMDWAHLALLENNPGMKILDASYMPGPIE